jgi:Transposase DDE domain
VARLLGRLHAGPGLLLKLVVAPLLTHDLARVQAVHPALHPGDVRVADRGLCAYAHLALLVQAGVHAVLRVGARQIVDFTPGRRFVTPGVRRTPAVKGVPRPRWRKTLGGHDPRVTWLKPTTCPAWLTREALAALPETLEVREVRDHLGRPGFRTRPITLVTTRLDADLYRVADLAELYRQRWQVEIFQPHDGSRERVSLATACSNHSWIGFVAAVAMVSTSARRPARRGRLRKPDHAPPQLFTAVLLQPRARRRGHCLRSGPICPWKLGGG